MIAVGIIATHMAFGHLHAQTSADEVQARIQTRIAQPQAGAAYLEQKLNDASAQVESIQSSASRSTLTLSETTSGGSGGSDVPQPMDHLLQF